VAFARLVEGATSRHLTLTFPSSETELWVRPLELDLLFS